MTRSIRQQNAERRLRHCAWEREPVSPWAILSWFIVAMAVALFIVPQIMAYGGGK